MEENSPAVIPFPLAGKRPRADNLEDITPHLLAALQSGMDKIRLRAWDVLPDIMGAMHGEVKATNPVILPFRQAEMRCPPSDGRKRKG